MSLPSSRMKPGLKRQEDSPEAMSHKDTHARRTYSYLHVPEPGDQSTDLPLPPLFSIPTDSIPFPNETSHPFATDHKLRIE